MGARCAGVAVAAFLLAACSDEGKKVDVFDGDDGGIGSVDGGITSVGSDDGSTSGSGDGSDAGTTGAGTDGGESDGGTTGAPPRFDVGNGDGAASTDDGIGGESGCDAVDFLFVIDNSGSMGDNQANLVASFPGFIQAIQSSVTEANDYHVMVTDTDRAWGSFACGPFCATLGACPAVANYPCSYMPTACDQTFGAGMVYPVGDDASNQICPIPEGRRYLTPLVGNLAESFECIASVGTDGDSTEQPIQAMTGALSDALNGPGGCNEGFIRDDAILVVIIITDEDDDTSNGSPAGWFANVVAAKGGGEGIVMIGLLNDVDQPTPLCPVESDPQTNLTSFVEMFPNNFRGSVCAPNYADVLQDAVQLIDSTCRDYVPPAG